MRPVEHRPYMHPSGGGQLYPASRDMTTPFPFGFLLPKAMGYKAKGKWEALGHGPAVEDTAGATAHDLAFSSLAFAPPDPPTGVPASGIRYGFYHV